VADLNNEQLRAISPFLVKDTDVLVLAEGRLERGKITLNSEENAAFAKVATDWEQKNCPLLTGSNRWTIITDDAETIIGYTSIADVTGVFHLWIKDINGEMVTDRTVGEKPLEPDPLGDSVAATVLTLGASLVLRSVAAGIARVASAAAAAGARVVSIAVSRVVAGDVTDGVVLTALRSVRAQAIAKALQARGIPVIVNIGGEAGTEELIAFGPDQIALNHQVRMGIAKRFVPNLVKENGERIGEVFGENIIDKVVSRRLDANFDVIKLSRGAFRALKPGGTVEMQIFSNNAAFADAFITALENAGFKNVSADFNVLFKAVK
jgi:hypothetical protein